MFGRSKRDDENRQPTPEERAQGAETNETEPQQPERDDEGRYDLDGDPDATAELLGRLETERDEFREKYLRALAEYQNYQRRALVNEREAREQGVRAVLTSLLAPLDHFDLALGQDPSKASAEQILSGVRVIRDEILKVLGLHGVGVVSPQRGDEFVPTHHEAIMQQEAEDVEPGHIVSVMQPGYTLNERVVRPAKVSVRPSQD